MKQLVLFLLLSISVWSCQNTTEQATTDTPTSTPKKKKSLSPSASTMAMIGDAHIHIDYSSPGVRGRSIFGTLIPYNKLWRAGANQATSIETNADLLIDGQILASGKYGFFIIPSEKKWTIIFNKRWDQHGTDKYTEAEDVLRLEVTPTRLIELQEHLKYQVAEVSEQAGILILTWEKTKLEVPFQLK